MALSKKTVEAFRRAFTEQETVDEVVAAIEAGGNPQAAEVAALGAQAPVSAVDVADAGPQDVADAADVDAKVAALQAKVDELLAALKAAGIMAS
jgi:hypothetical protein